MTISSDWNFGGSVSGRKYATRPSSASVNFEAPVARSMTSLLRMSSVDLSTDRIAAAMSRMFERSALPDCSTASPPMPAPREAQVPPPYGVVLVSPVMTLTLSMVTPTAVAAIWAKMASVPWPCSVTLESTVSMPVGSRRSVAPSWAEMRAPPTP